MQFTLREYYDWHRLWPLQDGCRDSTRRYGAQESSPVNARSVAAGSVATSLLGGFAYLGVESYELVNNVARGAGVAGINAFYSTVYHLLEMSGIVGVGSGAGFAAVSACYLAYRRFSCWFNGPRYYGTIRMGRDINGDFLLLEPYAYSSRYDRQNFEVEERLMNHLVIAQVRRSRLNLRIAGGIRYYGVAIAKEGVFDRGYDKIRPVKLSFEPQDVTVTIGNLTMAACEKLMESDCMLKKASEDMIRLYWQRLHEGKMSRSKIIKAATCEKSFLKERSVDTERQLTRLEIRINLLHRTSHGSRDRKRDALAELVRLNEGLGRFSFRGGMRMRARHR